MNVNEALDILAIKDMPVTKDIIKLSHRRLLSKYHPDRNPDGHIMSQKINTARDFLFKQHLPIENQYKTPFDDYTQFLYGVIITKIVGKTCVSGNTFQFKDILKEHKFRWNPDEKHWWCYGYYPIEKFLEEAF